MTDLLERVTRSIAQYHGWFGGWRKFLPDGRAALAAMTPEDHAAVLRDAGWSVSAPATPAGFDGVADASED
mgnify:CR=1 FL=1